MEEQNQELTEFQQQFRERTLKEEEELRKNVETDWEEDVDTQKGRYMTFRCDKDYYGIAITYVNEIIGIQQIAKVPDTPDYIKGLINLRGKIIPIVDVRTRFKKPEIPYNDRTCVIVINVEDDIIGLIVDTIADVVTIADEDVLAPPASKSASNRFVFGLGKVGDQVKLLIDPARLVYERDPVTK